MQARALYSLAIIPRNLHGTPRSIQFRADLNTLARSRSTHNRDKRSLRNAAHSRALRIYLRYSNATTRRAFKAHIRNSPATPRITLYYNFSLFSVAFLLFLFLFGRSCGRQNLSYSSIYRNTSFLPARRPTTRSLAVLTLFIAPLRGDIPPPRAFRVLFARLPPSPRQLLPLTLPLDTPFCLFRLPIFPQAVQGSAFLCVLVSCGTHVLSFTKTSTFIEVFARLCIFIHCVIACFSAYAFAFSAPAILSPLPLCGIRSRLGAAPPLLFPSPASPPGLPFSSALVFIPFFAVEPPAFFDFSISFCLMPHGACKLFVCFSLPLAFRAFPSMIRSASSPVFD